MDFFKSIKKRTESSRVTHVNELNVICKKCNFTCNAIKFQRNFENWTSGNDNVDKFIQDTQLSAHVYYGVYKKALEWIPYDRFNDIKSRFDEPYRANWIDGYIDEWDYYKKKNWERNNINMFVTFKVLNVQKDITLEFMNEIKTDHEFYGITQNPKTNNYMMVLNDKCRKCNCICNVIHFRQNFEDWTSGNDYIDKFIQDTQLSVHKNTEATLEWIPYDRFNNTIKSRFGETYIANWIDGCIYEWDDKKQNWKRNKNNMIVILKILNNPKNITLEFMNEKTDHEFYGITQNPKTNNYMMVLNDKCKKCNYICNVIHFQQNFIDWTSGNDYIDKFIQDTQLSAHVNYEVYKEALEWIPYDRFNNTIKSRFGETYRANWIDGYIYKWDDKKQNWQRNKNNMIVILKILNNPKNIILEFMNEINGFYGITQHPKTNNYMMVLNDKCKECNYTCNAIHFQQNFVDWTSGNDYIDKFLQDTQLSGHDDYGAYKKALEWIPFDRFSNTIKSRLGETYGANWIDGYIYEWDNENQNWQRNKNNMIVILKILNNPKNIILEFMNEINGFYGITQHPETNNYMMVLNCKNCEKCHDTCNAIHFQHNFENWTSGNDDINKFIQDTQLSVHDNYEVFKKALEWIPYDRLYDIKYITKGGFGKVYRANWIDGYIDSKWDGYQKWKRINKNMIVALKSLDNSKNVTLKFMNEIMSHNKGKIDNNFIIRFYGITQDPKTKDYMMILDYAEDGSLRDYLDKNYSILNWDKKIGCLQDAILGLRCIHEKELFHRDLHIGNILKLKYNTVITDMGLCKPANYDASENSIYGNLAYIAPEILRGKNYTKAADIYSFGIIMYEVISGLRPYHNPIKKENSEFVLKSMENVRKISVRPENIWKRSRFGTLSGRTNSRHFLDTPEFVQNLSRIERPENVPKHDRFRMFSGRTENFRTFSILFRTNSEFSFFIGLLC
ncbi:Tpk1p [Rhizophagus irregularis DAOM 197198w]|uniref:Tpk1p n=1 Tax=Rhizophagus irregularis (strain DAOM 197198w) TaxID=1432141 RepID=A0A015KKI7_RHIIW|nr:Tpk1p [Rhizophagus irregularis DAOM 197198w]